MGRINLATGKSIFYVASPFRALYQSHLAQSEQHIRAAKCALSLKATIPLGDRLSAACLILSIPVADSLYLNRNKAVDQRYHLSKSQHYIGRKDAAPTKGYSCGHDSLRGSLPQVSVLHDSSDNLIPNVETGANGKNMLQI